MISSWSWRTWGKWWFSKKRKIPLKCCTNLKSKRSITARLYTEPILSNRKPSYFLATRPISYTIKATTLVWPTKIKKEAEWLMPYGSKEPITFWWLSIARDCQSIKSTSRITKQSTSTHSRLHFSICPTSLSKMSAWGMLKMAKCMC